MSRRGLHPGSARHPRGRADRPRDPGHRGSRVIARLARDGVPLAVCPTSKIRTGVVPAYAEHPLRRLYEAGVRVTVNSDDPAFFGASVTDELRLCLTTLGFTPPELAVMAQHAAAAAFLEAPARDRLQACIRAGWAGLAGVGATSI